MTPGLTSDDPESSLLDDLCDDDLCDDFPSVRSPEVNASFEDDEDRGEGDFEAIGVDDRGLGAFEDLPDFLSLESFDDFGAGDSSI